MIDVILLSAISAIWACNVFVHMRLIPARFADEVARDRKLRLGLKTGEYAPVVLGIPVFVGSFDHLAGGTVVVSFLAGQIVGAFFGALRVARGMRRPGMAARSVRNTSWTLAGLAMATSGAMACRVW